jgi:hypothetical protein
MNPQSRRKAWEFTKANFDEFRQRYKGHFSLRQIIQFSFNGYGTICHPALNLCPFLTCGQPD